MNERLGLKLPSRWCVAAVLGLAAVGGGCSTGATADRFGPSDETRASVGRRSSTTPPSADADGCAAIADVLDELVGVDGADAATLADALDGPAERLRAISAGAAEMRSELAGLLALLDVLGAQLRTLAAVRPAADLESAAAIDDVVATMPAYVHLFAMRETLSSAAPALVEHCTIKRSMSVDDITALASFVDAVEGFAETGVADDPRLGGLVAMAESFGEMGGKVTGVGESGMDDAVADCVADFGATGPGDNEGCDSLLAACDVRDLAACNDLYLASVPGTEYESIGATCGGRVRFGDSAFAGFCERLDAHGLRRLTPPASMGAPGRPGRIVGRR